MTTQDQIQDLDDIKNLDPGDMLPPIDEIVRTLLDNGYDADYHNTYTDSAGWLASFEVDGCQVMVVDAMRGDEMVRQVDRHKIEELQG